MTVLLVVAGVATSVSAERVPLSHSSSVRLPFTASTCPVLRLCVSAALFCHLAAALGDGACDECAGTRITLPNHACMRIGSSGGGAVRSRAAEGTYLLIALAERAAALWSTGSMASLSSSSESRRRLLYPSG